MRQLAMNKSELRKIMATKRDNIPIKERIKKSQIVENKLRKLQAYQQAKLSLVYVSFRSEIDTQHLIKNALEEGKRIAVPVSISTGKVLLPCEIFQWEDLVPGTWGILEPAKEKRRIIHNDEIDLAVVPGLAFDIYGNRLGYGAGYYDRFLPSLRQDAIKIGIGYDVQIMEELPTQFHDVPLDGVLTDAKIILRNNIR